MPWFKNWLKPLPPQPAHRCHFRRLRADWTKNKCVYRCSCGAMYGMGNGPKGWVHKPARDLSKY